MKRFKQDSEFAKVVAELERTLGDIGVTIKSSSNGIVISYNGMSAIYLDIEGTETTMFPHPFETKLIEYDSYMNGE